jgi:hypothetical protein
VLGSSVSLVVLETVRREPTGELVEHAIALDLRDDRRRRDGGTESVSVNDRKLGKPDPGNRDRVYEQRLRLRVEREDRELHRGEARAQDVSQVDLRCAHDADSDGERVRADRGREPLPARRVEPLRVIEADEDAARRQDHGRRHDGAGERSATGLVDTRNETVAPSRELRLDPGELPKAAELGEQSRERVRPHRTALCQT